MFEGKRFHRIYETGRLCGSSLQGSIKLDPHKLIWYQGLPGESDGYKVSGEYIFESEDKKSVLSLYDWKMTSLYDKDYLTPFEVWLSDSLELNIGGFSQLDIPEFKEWLRYITT